MSVREALQSAMVEEMQRDEKVFLMGTLFAMIIIIMTKSNRYR